MKVVVALILAIVANAAMYVYLQQRPKSEVSQRPLQESALIEVIEQP